MKRGAENRTTHARGNREQGIYAFIRAVAVLPRARSMLIFFGYNTRSISLIFVGKNVSNPVVNRVFRVSFSLCLAPLQPHASWRQRYQAAQGVR